MLKEKKIEWLAVIFLLAAVVFLFWPIIHSGYFADDYFYANKALAANGAPWWQMWWKNIDSAPSGSSWRPLTAISLRLTMLWGNPFLDHVVALGLFLAALFLFYLLLRELIPEEKKWWRLGFLGLAAVAPTNIEPVYWVAARADLLAAIGGLAALIFWQKKKYWYAVPAVLFSLLSKEFWILLPLALMFWAWRSKEKNSYWPAITLGATTLLWVVARWLITSYALGGYSANNLLARWDLCWHVVREAYSFLVSLFLSGKLFLNVALWLQSNHWVGLMAVVIVVSATFWCSGKRAREFWLLTAGLLAPALLLFVPVTSGVVSLAETRYWFAPTWAAILWLAVWWTEKKRRGLARTFAGALLIIWISSNIIGLRQEIKIVQQAAVARQEIISGWQNAPAATTQIVAFLPDTYQGVHLFAAPFFEQALIWHKAAPPAQVWPYYQQCGEFCVVPLQLVFEKNTLRISAETPRLFFVPSNKRVKEFSFVLPPKTPLSLWNGLTWQFIGQKAVEKPNQPHY